MSAFEEKDWALIRICEAFGIEIEEIGSVKVSVSCSLESRKVILKEVYLSCGHLSVFISPLAVYTLRSQLKDSVQ